MKLINKLGATSVILAALLSTGCLNDTNTPQETAKTDTVKTQEVVTEASLGLRKTDIYSENTTSANKTEYVTASAGTSTKFKRAFQDAPPMIPHDVEGMLPIKIGDNQCTGCHMPEVAAYMDPKPTPIPSSHFINFRPTHNFDGKMFTKSIDNYKNEMAISKVGTTLQGARYNCSQCHAPQSQGNLAVENTFEANYTKKDGATKSSWNGTTLTDSLDTVGANYSFVTEDDIANKNSQAGSLDH